MNGTVKAYWFVLNLMYSISHVCPTVLVKSSGSDYRFWKSDVKGQGHKVTCSESHVYIFQHWVFEIMLSVMNIDQTCTVDTYYSLHNYIVLELIRFWRLELKGQGHRVITQQNLHKQWRNYAVFYNTFSLLHLILLYALHVFTSCIYFAPHLIHLVWLCIFKMYIVYIVDRC